MSAAGYLATNLVVFALAAASETNAGTNLAVALPMTAFAACAPDTCWRVSGISGESGKWQILPFASRVLVSPVTAGFRLRVPRFVNRFPPPQMLAAFKLGQDQVAKFAT